MSPVRSAWQWGVSALAASIVACLATPVAAQTAQPSDEGFLNFFRKTEIAGTADVYFHYNFNEPETGSKTPLRNFDFDHNQFSFALAEIALIKAPTDDDRVGFRLDLDYGPVTDWVHSADPAGPEVVKHFQQAYISYLAPVGRGLSLDIGKFVTQHGAEVIEAKDNWNYSRSLLFAWAIPYYHMGFRLGYSPNDVVTLGASVNNGWNNTTDNNSQKTYGFQAVVKPTAAVSIVQNYMVGPEQTDNTDDWRHLADTTVTYTVTPQFSLMGNYDYGRDASSGRTVSWQGIGIYAKAQATPFFALIPRYEYYNDEDGFTTGTAQNVQEFTLTAEVRHSQGLIMRLEYRRDWSDVDFFTKRGRPRDNQNTFSVGFVYAFSTRQ
ncbi:MAG: porin [Acidobacteria bacterium]|nr:porin [Acidobacteriota bacterium]